ncbi:hypothetical protein QR680_016446 [Steinernema hermaphroditum]|uniref:G-protein coupled receptors family 1 profile domain-containing protein n=1 Tax=Steinernema hermaphroditum TaxID=289476 RepID=A0AA39HCD3_9BILA|nr:hypothetical protein QR680_016446 [Steinernema hermaphroditum]
MSSTNDSFIFGAELLGRGHPTSEDRYVGTTMLLLALSAVLLGIYNLYIMKKMDIFHNAFGWFWASRTVGEVGCNLVHVLYSGPVTVLQPVNIPPAMGVWAFEVGYFFACHACVMHQAVSVNRMMAVCFPIKYRHIFTLKFCIIVIAVLWIEVFFVLLAYVVIPCNMVGYSPTLYEYVFVKCNGSVGRGHSVVGTVVNRLCFAVCLATVFCDLMTFSKILKSRLERNQCATFNRDVRFFCQTSVQNITTLIITHINNALALILFNPEVRDRIFQIERTSPTDAKARRPSLISSKIAHLPAATNTMLPKSTSLPPIPTTRY